jgi:serine/threonine protein kinase
MPEPTNPSERPAPTQVGATPFPVIPGYRFQKALGKGGMATVYLATQESLDRPVGIKVMAREALTDEISKQRFENEARTIAKLSHTGIVGIHEVGRTPDGRMYYVMPYLPNGDLSQRDLRSDEARIVEVLRSLLSALGYAHAHGIVHRDVKEENVLFDTHDRPLLTDFGIARSKRDTTRLTTAGFSVGSAGFMAPEQARGEEVDGRADLYSVGVLSYALLTGNLPFRATDALALAIMHAQDSVPRLPPEKRHWQGFIDRAMAKSPSQRFANAQQMLQALDKIGSGVAMAWPERARQGFDRVVEKAGGKRRFGVLVLAAALLLSIVGYVAHRWFAQPNTAVVSAPAPAILKPVNASRAPSPASAPTVEPAAEPPVQPGSTSKPGDASTEVPASTPAQSTAPTTAQKPASKPASAQKSTQSTPAKPATTAPQPKKKKSWFSRLFHRH